MPLSSSSPSTPENHPAGGSRLGLALSLILGAVVLAAFGWNVHHFFFLGDDAFISFRYSKHLVDGLGLVWNPGERVEGYTNFLWVLLMAGGLRVGVAPEHFSVILGIASGSALLLLVAGISARRHGLRQPLMWIAPAALALSRSFTAWCSSGLETMFFALLVFAAFLCFQREAEQGRRPVGSALLFALATMTRPEGAIFAAAAGLAFLLAVALRRRRWRHGAVFVGAYLLLAGGHLLWRRWYYGDWVPNTFHAKVEGTWVDQGLMYLKAYDLYYHVAWFLPLTLLALFARSRPSLRLPFFAALVYLAYVVMVGGDIFEFRFLVPVLPAVALLVAEGILILRDRLATIANPAAGTALAVLLGGLFVGTTHAGSRAEVAREDRPQIKTLDTIRGYARNRIEQGQFLRDALDAGKMSRKIVMCVGGAGAVPYYTDLVTVDRRGLSDAYIARLPVENKTNIAHQHDAPVAYLREREVAVFAVHNKLLFRNDQGVKKGTRVQHQLTTMEMRAVRIDERYLVFATFVPDRKLERLFRGAEILRPPRPGQ